MTTRMEILGTKVNPDTARRAKRRAKKKGFSNVSAYLRSLIQADLKRDERDARRVKKAA